MDTETSMSVPLDDDGFLRRECPTCEREFKWLPGGDQSYDAAESGVDVDPAGYFCPYCGVQAPTSNWFTKSQIEAAKATLLGEILPEMRNWGRGLERSSGGLLKIEVDVPDPPDVPALTEENDMRRVEFECHPSEPLKVLETWDQRVRCLVCGVDADSDQ